MKSFKELKFKGEVHEVKFKGEVQSLMRLVSAKDVDKKSKVEVQFVREIP